MIIDQLFENNKKPLNEVDPRNFDSDEDYYAALDAPAKRRSAPSDYPYSPEEDDAYFREIFRKKREAAKKAEQDKQQGVTESRRYKLEESRILESATYKQFHQVGRMLAERKMSEKEILDLFANVEKSAGAAGGNRTALGKAKDVTTNAAASLKDAVSGVLSSIQNSAPVAGVDVAYDQATDALANAVGNNSKVMDSIKKYRLLAKEYPKTQLFVKTALIALAGLATGGAGLPVIAGLTAAVDSAIKGEKLSSIIGKGAGAGLMGLGAQEVNSMLSGADSAGAPGDSSATTNAGQFKDTDSMGFAGRGTAGPEAYNQQQNFQLPDADAAMNSQADIDAAREWINGDEETRTDIEQVTGMSAAQLQDIAVANDLATGGSSAAPGAEGFGGGTYTVQAGDQGGYIAQSMGIPFKELEGLNPQITNWNKLPVGTELQLPPTGDNVGSVWRDVSGAPSAAATSASATPAATPAATPVTAQPFGSGPPDTSLLGDRTERYIPQPDGSWLDASTGQVADPAKLQASQDAVRNTFRPRPSMQGLRESINFKTIPADQLIDQKLTVLGWALNESTNRPMGQSVHLTRVGVFTVFENVDRYRKAIITMEATGPARGQLPDYYRPDMPGAPAPQTAQPGAVGRGLNWLDSAAGKFGSAVSKFGKNFTNKVTADKLKMNWHQKGKPTDSDQLSAFLSQQGVPQPVIQDVYSSMGIEYDPATAGQTFDPRAVQANTTSGLEVPDESGMINPATGKGWTKSELAQSRQEREADAARAANASAIAKKVASSSKDQLAATMGLTSSPKAVPTATQPTATPGTAPATTAQGWNDPKSANYVGRREVARRQAATPAAPAPAKPNYAGPGGYASVKMNAPTGATLPRTVKPASSAATPQLSKDEYIKRIGADAAQPVAETIRQVMKMLEAVRTKQDAQFIKNYIDTQFGSNLTETAKAQRNKLIEHVTKVTAVRRRQFAKAN